MRGKSGCDRRRVARCAVVGVVIGRLLRSLCAGTTPARRRDRGPPCLRPAAADATRFAGADGPDPFGSSGTADVPFFRRLGGDGLVVAVAGYRSARLSGPGGSRPSCSVGSPSSANSGAMPRRGVSRAAVGGLGDLVISAISSAPRTDVDVERVLVVVGIGVASASPTARVGAARRPPTAAAGACRRARRAPLTRSVSDDRLGDPLPLGDEVLLEVVDVGLQEVAPGQQRLHLALDLHPLGLAGPAGLGLGLLDQLGGLGAGAVEAGGGVVASSAEQPIGLGLGLGDRRVGRALGEQQGAADRLGLVDVGPAPRRGRLPVRPSAARRPCGQLLQPGDGGPGPASIAVASFCAVSSAVATSSTKASTSPWS